MAEQKQISRLWLYIPFAIAGVILFAYFLLWRAGAAEMKKSVHAWAEEQRAAGLDVSYGDLKASGFPFFLRVHVDAPDIAETGAWRWQSEGLYLDALPYDLNKLIISPMGEQTINLRNGEEWRVTAADLRASIARDARRGWIYSMTIGEIAGKEISTGASWQLSSLIFDLAPDAEDVSTLTLNLAAEGLAYRSPMQSFDIPKLNTLVSLTQTPMLSTPDPLENWRFARGELAIHGIYAELNEARLTAEGALHLDEIAYPEGTVTAELSNPAGFAQFLVDAGVMSQEEGEVAAANLGLAAIAAGGKIIAPIKLKNGAVEIAGVKLADLPRLEE